jgi:NAD(P)-dependent dehydrogenase (short-subunit alcohol dehydrogenase family)
MTTDMFDLTGKVAVITGGSRGLGRAIAETLAGAGADVVIASRKLPECEKVAAAISSTTGRRAVPIACHVGKWAECEALIASAVDAFDRLDILVNNAGMSPLYDSLSDVSEALYDKTLDVNLKGPFRLSSLAGTYMAAHGGGSIINIGTIGSVIASPNELPYACAKAGLNAMTVGMAAAFAPKVRVNAILPGAFRTSVSSSWPAEALSGDTVPLGRIGEPHEIAGLALYLASPAGSYTTGAIMRVDGGAARMV